MIEIKSKLQFDELIEEDKVVIEFYADWCGPCKIQTTHLESLEEEFPDIKIAKINTDNFLGIARKYRVISIPNLKLFKKGKVSKEVSGLQDIDSLREFIKD